MESCLCTVSRGEFLEVIGSPNDHQAQTMRPSQLLVDGLGGECVKIEKGEAIAKAQHGDQTNISGCAENGLIDPDACWKRSVAGKME
jgi:hypothetical protein